MRFYLALWICKAVTRLLRILKRGGTALPGKLALALCPDMLSRLADGFTVAAVTGTNGKTTTAIFMSAIFTENGIRHITNRSGSNLERGITAAFAEGVTFTGRPRGECRHAVIECDEAAFRRVAGKLRPAVIVVTNFFKDQLDRYGEVTHTLELVREGIKAAPEAVLVLNADDHLCASLGRDTANKAIYYGLNNSEHIVTEETGVLNETGNCIYCKEKYEYSFTVYGHLGGFSCPGCGYSRPEPDIEIVSVEEAAAEHMTFTYLLRKNQAANAEAAANTDAAANADTATNTNDRSAYQATIELPGAYNLYNAAAAVGMGEAMGLSPESFPSALCKCGPGFGRMETVKDGEKSIRVILVKNPMGFNQVINYITDTDEPVRLMFAINDNYADGTDISWLWDVNFERLAELGGKLEKAYVCGIRGADMAVRLKYADIAQCPVTEAESIGAALDTAVGELRDDGAADTLVILPTYTAMLKVREELRKRYNMKEFWC